MYLKLQAGSRRERFQQAKDLSTKLSDATCGDSIRRILEDFMNVYCFFIVVSRSHIHIISGS